MKDVLLIAAAVATLAGCNKAPEATNSSDGTKANVAEATSTAPKGNELSGTSWTFRDAKVGEIVATFGTDGHYYDVNKGKVVESGTFHTADAKVCEHVDGTAANETVCWSLPDRLPAMGGTLKTASNKGQTVTATRVAFKGNAPRQ